MKKSNKIITPNAGRGYSEMVTRQQGGALEQMQALNLTDNKRGWMELRDGTVGVLDDDLSTKDKGFLDHCVAQGLASHRVESVRLSIEGRRSSGYIVFAPRLIELIKDKHPVDKNPHSYFDPPTDKECRDYLFERTPRLVKFLSEHPKSVGDRVICIDEKQASEVGDILKCNFTNSGVADFYNVDLRQPIDIESCDNPVLFAAYSEIRLRQIEQQKIPPR